MHGFYEREFSRHEIGRRLLENEVYLMVSPGDSVWASSGVIAGVALTKRRDIGKWYPRYKFFVEKRDFAQACGDASITSVARRVGTLYEIRRQICSAQDCRLRDRLAKISVGSGDLQVAILAS